MKIYGWMASNGLFTVGDGKSNTVRKMDNKKSKNQINEKILEYFQEIAVEYLDNITIGGFRWNKKKITKNVESYFEYHRILKDIMKIQKK